MARSRDRLKAAKARQVAAEAFVSAVKLRAAGKLRAAHDAMQTAVLATKESLNLQYPWSEREQLQLDTILRGGVRSDGERPLDEIFCGPSQEETRDRVQQFLGWQKAVMDAMESHSDSTRTGLENMRKAEEGTPRQKLHPELIAALAEIELREGSRSKSKDADAHLKIKHRRLWRDVWFPLSDSRRREIMIESQHVRQGKR